MESNEYPSLQITVYFSPARMLSVTGRYALLTTGCSQASPSAQIGASLSQLKDPLVQLAYLSPIRVRDSFLHEA